MNQVYNFAFEAAMVCNDVKFNCDKTRCIVSDVYRYFDKPDGRFPTSDTLSSIMINFNEIGLRLAVALNMIDKIEQSLEPITLDDDIDTGGV